MLKFLIIIIANRFAVGVIKNGHIMPGQMRHTHRFKYRFLGRKPGRQALCRVLFLALAVFNLPGRKHAPQKCLAIPLHGMRDPLNLASAINHRVDGDRLTILFVRPLGLAEIQATGQFADAEHIETPGDQRFLDGRSVGELGETNGRTEIGKEPELLAQQLDGNAAIIVRCGLSS